MNTVLYLNNLILDDIVEIRDNLHSKSQAGNNKIQGIRRALESNGVKVINLSSGLVNKKSGKRYGNYSSKLDRNLIYVAQIDLPLINTLSAIYYMYKEVERQIKNGGISNILFYNYKPEVAIPALLAKIKYKIPITVEHEDGCLPGSKLGYIKRLIFQCTERIVKPFVSSAILVSSKMKTSYHVESIVVRGIIDEKFRDQCKMIKKPNDEIIYAMYSGSLDEERGLGVILDSMSYLDDKVIIKVSGRGVYSDMLSQVKDKHLEYIGYADYSYIQKKMSESDILLNTQLVNTEFCDASFPSKLFEYLATGNRIISSKVADVEEFAQGGMYLYDNNDSMNLAEAINAAVKDIRANNVEKLSICNELCENNTAKKIGENICRILHL